MTAPQFLTHASKVWKLKKNKQLDSMKILHNYIAHYSVILYVIINKGGVTYWLLGAPKMPTVGSRSLGTKLGEACIVILIHCAIMLLKILNVYCLK